MSVNDQLRREIRPLPRAKYQIDHAFGYVEKALTELEADWGLNLVPDFQRGHVWTQSQQERYIEAIMRGQISDSGLIIQFNAPHWENYNYEGDLPRELQCIDGLQRLTAVRRFMAGEIKVYGRTVSEFEGTDFSVRRLMCRLKFTVHIMQTREEVLQYYLDLNVGGTPHTEEEIMRVRGLLHDASADQAAPSEDLPKP